MSVTMHNGVLSIQLEEAINLDRVRYGQQAHSLIVQPIRDGVSLFPKVHNNGVQPPIVLGKTEMVALTLRLMELCHTHGVEVGMVDSVDATPHLEELDKIDDSLSNDR